MDFVEMSYDIMILSNVLISYHDFSEVHDMI